MNYEVLGKISIGKETDKFKPYTETVYDSGWKKTVLKFNAICGDNRHMLQVDAGAWADGHGDIITFSKATVNEDGSKKKVSLEEIQTVGMRRNDALSQGIALH